MIYVVSALAWLGLCACIASDTGLWMLIIGIAALAWLPPVLASIEWRRRVWLARLAVKWLVPLLGIGLLSAFLAPRPRTWSRRTP